jgi:hypothetical protein
LKLHRTYSYWVDRERFTVEAVDGVITGSTILQRLLYGYDPGYILRRDTGPRYWEHPEITAGSRIELSLSHEPRFYLIPRGTFATR